MNRNTNEHFSTIPQLDGSQQRSRFDRSHSLKTTFSSGKLVPIMCEEVLPGDTITLDTSVVCRMTTPLYPVMDSCFLDVYYFFVPNRLVFDKWKYFMGEDEFSAWDDNVEYEIPQIKPYEGPAGCRFEEGSLADYFGLPTDVLASSDYSVSALPFRAYYLIWNEFFRAQAIQDPVYIDTSSYDSQLMSLFDYEESYYPNAINYGALMKVGKFFDYFTSCLPSPQKGQPVALPLNGLAPVITTSDNHNSPGNVPLNAYFNGLDSVGNVVASNLSNESGTFSPRNLYADLGSSDFVSINDLRNAITIQHFLEAEARGGSRYTEIIKTFFGVTSPDARLQRPEYLGGKQIPINIDQVVQTSSSNNEPSPLGNTGAFSLTGDKDSSFTYSSTEHGWILGLCCVRPRHTYQRGIERKWLRKQRFDYYFPVFSNISEQPVYCCELNASEFLPDEVFGYNEPWADYRYSQNRVTGGFRYNAEDSLSPWIYTDMADSASVISNDFIKEDPSIIGETLAYQANEDVQFLADFYFISTWTRPMPVYSVPGLSRI